MISPGAIYIGKRPLWKRIYDKIQILRHLIKIVPASEITPGKIKFYAYDLSGSIWGNIRIGRFIGKPILYTSRFTVLICKNWQK